MILQLEKIHNWLAAKTTRELGILLLASLLLIFLLWYYLLAAPLWQKQGAIQAETANLQTTVTKLQSQLKLLSITNPAPEALQEHARLIAQLNQVNGELSHYKQQLIPPKKMVIALKSILAASQNLALLSLENLPATAVDKDANNASTPVFQHTFVIELSGNYFALLQYLQQLEALPWFLNWDELNYQVINYPDAKITIKLHILSNEEKLINV